MQVCRTCGELKPVSCFYLRKDVGRYRTECKDCWCARTSFWQAVNSDKVRGYVRKSCKKLYDADPEKFREKSRAARAANPEGKRATVRQSNKKRYYENYDNERIRLNIRAAARRRASPPWLTKVQKDEIKALYAEARRLEKETGVKWHVDHIEPLNGLNVCGLHVPWNLQLLTASENCSKKNIRRTA
jgi:hypothetical protein